MTPGRQRLLSLASVATVVMLWELVARMGWVSPVLLSSPTKIAAAAVTLATRATLWQDLAYSGLSFVVAVVVAVVVGVLVGGLIGTSRAAYAVLNPFVVAVNALPKVVLMPLVVLWVGIGMSANVLLGAVMASFPIITATFSGIAALENDALRVARAFGASRRTTITTVVIPGVIPFALAGLRVAVNYAMVGVLIAEFFGSAQGVGYRMMLLMANFEVAGFFVYMVIVALVSVAVTAAVHTVERRVHRWRPEGLAGSERA